jgi:acyl-CoA reductase-like NAD-dependent aldehyde dehydrogenase
MSSTTGLNELLWVAGRARPAADGQTFETRNPADGTVVATVARAGVQDVHAAVTAARVALEESPWQTAHPRTRTTALLKMSQLIAERHEELARLEVLDTGKPLANATREVLGVSAQFEYFAGWATKIYGDVNPSPAEMLVYARREPVGVVGAIIPWNFPLSNAAWKVAPALASGCAVVLKPAEQTPLTALRLAEIAAEAGVPDGILSVLPGFGDVGAALVKHPGIDKIAFTGSTPVGKEIMRSAADNVTRLSLELGGKSPNIVLADADLEAAAFAAMSGAFRNTGQICVAATRLLVQDSIHDDFVAAVVAQSAKMVMGDPFDAATTLGPVVSDEQHARVTGYIDIGRDEGAELATGGGHPTEGPLADGYYVEPTIFTGVRSDMRIAQEEIFGPVLSVIPVSGVDDAIRVANDTQFGLSAAVWTRDVNKALTVANGLQSGTVWVNTYGNIDPLTSFGGVKQSGFGRELGRHAIDMYTEIKNVWIAIGDTTG